MDMNVYLLDAPSSGCALPGSLSSKLLTRSLATRGLASSLLGSCHFCDLLAVRAMKSLKQESKEVIVQ